MSLQPFIDDSDILRVGGRKQLSQTSNYQSRPGILHPLTHLMIRHEHQRLLHAGPTLLSASLSRRCHIVGGRKVVRSVARKCIICHRYTARPKPQMLGQLPIKRITPGSVFDKVRVDYAGPLMIKYGHVRKLTVVNLKPTSVCLFL